MHASLEQLLEVRDGGETTPDVADHVADCGECARELDRLRRLRARMQALPAFTPPSANRWSAICDRGTRNEPTPGLRWLGAIGLMSLAASLAIVAVFVRAPAPAVPGTAAGFDPILTLAAAGDASGTPPETLELVARSRLLETTLRALTARPEVVNAGTESTIEMLEGHVALVDYQLSVAATQLSDEEAHRLWERRVELMDSLLNVRYAQLQRVDF